MTVLAALAMAGCGGAPERDYTATLTPVNHSGVAGTVHVTLAKPHLLVRVHARGLAGNRIHGQLLRAGTAGRCPAGSVKPDETRDAYGRVLKRLSPFPTVPKSGRLDFALDYPVGDAGGLKPLAGRVVVIEVLQGTLRREPPQAYRPFWPVACGELRPADGS